MKRQRARVVAKEASQTMDWIAMIFSTSIVILYGSLFFQIIYQ